MQKVRLTGTQGKGAKEVEQHVHPFDTASGEHVGAIVLTKRFLNFNPEFHPFLNDDFGIDMTQNIAFSGSPSVITTGGDSTGQWTTAIVAGTWDFNDTTNPFAGSACVSLTAANNNDQAIFSTSGTVGFNVKTAVTGQIRLETYDATVNSINLQFQNNNVGVGDPVNLNDVIDTGVLDAYQGIVIPKESFNITTESVDELNVTVVRTGGAKPTFRLDNVQIEASGTPAVFKSTTPEGTRFHITEIRIRMEDAQSAVLTDGSMPNLDPSKLIGVSALSNGIVFSRVEDGKTLFSVNLKDLGDFLATGSDLINVTGDATNTGLTLLVRFPEPIVLKGGGEDNFLSFTISDNLSELTRFTAAARGGLET